MMQLNLWSVFGRHRFKFQAGFDAIAWVVAIIGATALRYDFDITHVSFSNYLQPIGVAVVLQLLIGSRVGLYLHRWRYGVFHELGAFAGTIAAVTCLTALVNLAALSRPIPASAPIIAGAFASLIGAAGRYTWRVVLDRARRPDPDLAQPIVVLGAGDGGAQVIRAMLTSPDSPYLPVAVIDDNPERGNLTIQGVRVQGTRHDLARVAAHHGATAVLIAVPSATSELLLELSGIARAAGLQVLVLPAVSDLFDGAPGVGDIRPLTEEDLLGRRALNTDIDSVSGYLAGKRVLVTGAGGSIGSELCRQIHQFNPAQLIMLDRDESGLQAVQVSIEGQGLLDREELVVADIRDQERMFEVFEQFRPEVVFHAAALKHLTLLEHNPGEGWKTNVVGTHNMLTVAEAFNVDVFVNISTDKAADPTSVLGRTKRVAEQLTAAAAERATGTYLSVRFGNVLGSRGSMLPLFRRMIAEGGPVTVTHPDVTRYFMTIPEACQLVIQAGAIGEDGHVMVLDMGTPVRILDVAERLIAESGKQIEIVFTGLRTGEKLHEVLFGDEEQPVPSAHPLINCIESQPIDLNRLTVPTDRRGEPVIDLTTLVAGESEQFDVPHR